MVGGVGVAELFFSKKNYSELRQSAWPHGNQASGFASERDLRSNSHGLNVWESGFNLVQRKSLLMVRRNSHNRR